MTDRTQFIGGSDVAAILGVSPWKTPLQLYLEKIGETEPEPHDIEREKRLARGKRLEPIVIQMVLDEQTQLQLVAQNARYVDSGHSFLSCEIDCEFDFKGDEMRSIAADHINGEIKTVHPFSAKDWGEIGSDEIPIYYAAQVMYGLMLTGRQRALVAALIGADDLRIYWVERDDETCAAIRQTCIDFWARVQERRPPPATNAADVLLLHPRDAGKVIPADSHIIDWIDRATTERAIVDHHAAMLEGYRTRIKLAMGDASAIVDGGRTLATWKNNKPSTVTDWRNVAQTLGKITGAQALLAAIDQHTSTQPGERRFVIKQG